VAADVPYPAPLHAKRPTPDTFGAALLLGPADAPGTGSCPGLALELRDEAPATPCGHEGLDRLRQGVPAARALPLLQALARAQAAGNPTPTTVLLDALPGLSLAATVS
jgi:hypothetical protein